MRTQISLDDAIHAKVRQKAAELGITMAEYIRRLIDRDLEGSHPASDPSVIFGLGRSGGSDIANDRDAVADAVSAVVEERGR